MGFLFFFFFFFCLFVENVRLNSTGNHGFRIFVFYFFLLFSYPFCAFISPPPSPLHITTVKWVKVKSLNFRMSSFDNRSAICLCVCVCVCVCVCEKYIFWNATYQMDGYLYVAVEILKWNISEDWVLICNCGILKWNLSEGGVLICSCGILKWNVSDGGVLICSCGILHLVQ